MRNGVITVVGHRLLCHDIFVFLSCISALNIRDDYNLYFKCLLSGIRTLKVGFLIVLSQIFHLCKGKPLSLFQIPLRLSPVESEIVRVVSLSTTEITEITRFRKPNFRVRIPKFCFLAQLQKHSYFFPRTLTFITLIPYMRYYLGKGGLMQLCDA